MRCALFVVALLIALLGPITCLVGCDRYVLSANGKHPGLSDAAESCIPIANKGIVGDGGGLCGCIGFECCRFSAVESGCLVLGSTCLIYPGPQSQSCQPCGGSGQHCCLPRGDGGAETCNEGLTCKLDVYGPLCS